MEVVCSMIARKVVGGYKYYVCATRQGTGPLVYIVSIGCPLHLLPISICESGQRGSISNSSPSTFFFINRFFDVSLFLASLYTSLLTSALRDLGV